MRGGTSVRAQPPLLSAGARGKPRTRPWLGLADVTSEQFPGEMLLLSRRGVGSVTMCGSNALVSLLGIGSAPEPPARFVPLVPGWRRGHITAPRRIHATSSNCQARADSTEAFRVHRLRVLLGFPGRGGRSGGPPGREMRGRKSPPKLETRHWPRGQRRPAGHRLGILLDSELRPGQPWLSLRSAFSPPVSEGAARDRPGGSLLWIWFGPSATLPPSPVARPRPGESPLAVAQG